MNLEKAIIKTQTHRSEVRLQFFPSQVTPCFLSKSGGEEVSFCSCPQQLFADREPEEQRKDRKTENIHSSSCICALLVCP